MRTDAARLELARFGRGLKALYAREGAVGASRKLGRVAVAQALLPMTARRRSRERFELLGHALPYTFSRYNSSFLNERTVEVSIARWFLAQGATGRMLEVGNVLSHYGIHGHDVVDRYERAPGVINEDIVDFVPDESYDTVVSISTLEHVGRDETPRRPERAIAAFDVVQAVVVPGCRMLVIVPFGYNHAMDEAIRSGRIQMPRQTALVRVDRRNRWVEASVDEGLERPYSSSFGHANAIYVGIT